MAKQDWSAMVNATIKDFLEKQTTADLEVARRMFTQLVEELNNLLADDTALYGCEVIRCNEQATHAVYAKGGGIDFACKRHALLLSMGLKLLTTNRKPFRRSHE